MNLKKFRQTLVDQGLVVPAELSDDFEGNLVSFIESKHPDLIPGVLPEGALMLISETFSPEVAFCLATSVRHGCREGRWRAVRRNCDCFLFLQWKNLRRGSNDFLKNVMDIILIFLKT